MRPMPEILGAEEEISPPPITWWRQRELFIIEAIGLAAIGAGIAIATAPLSEFIRGLAGGALLGLGATMIIGTPFSVRDAWEQRVTDYRAWRSLQAPVALFRTQSANAFFLGVDTFMLTANPDQVPIRLNIIREHSAISGISFSEKENKLLSRRNPSPSQTAQITDLLWQKAQQRGSHESSFFRLGRLAGSVIPTLEKSRPIQSITRQLKHMQQNPFIKNDQIFSGLVTSLLKILTAFDETSVGAPRRAAITQALDVLSTLPAPDVATLDERPENFLIIEGEWYWTQDENGNGIPICFTDGYIISAPESWKFDISNDSPFHQAQVARLHDKWGCSAHPEADQNSPCFDIQLVFDHTVGGAPITEARTIFVRTAEDGSLEVLDPPK